MSHGMTDDDSLSLHAASFGVGKTTLLHGVSARFEPGRVTALLGPNGAGKTTLLHLAAGLNRPGAGAVHLAGRPLAQWPSAPLARTRALMAQHSALAFDFRVEEVVALGRHPHRRQPSPNEAHIVPAALAQVDATHLHGRRFGSLSGGEQARVQLARVMAQLWEPAPAADGRPQARWMLLDEPIAALDWAHQMRLMATVRQWAHEQYVGVVAIVHDLNIALRYADDALVLERGRVVAQGPCVATLTPALIRRVWDVHCQTIDLGDGVARLMA